MPAAMLEALRDNTRADGADLVLAEAEPKGRVRSVARALAIFELFSEARQPLGAKRISAAIDMPRSSTNVMLRGLCEAGYLQFDAASATYFPTLKVVCLGDWLFEGRGQETFAHDTMRVLQRESGETVALSMRHGFKARMIEVMDGLQPLRLDLKPGDGALIFSSAAGLAILAGHEDDAIETLVARWNMQPDAADNPVAIGHLREKIEEVRTSGVSVGYDLWLPDVGAIAVPLSAEAMGAPTALAVGGPSPRIQRREAEFVAMLKTSAAKLHSRANDPAP